mmetsp:Transcript_12332/g.29515  ORF Transcript_12332/g.29515 Transcript_12332/m.29515 type:complete len:342 (-) Transcript_12332:23-1048(-)
MRRPGKREEEDGKVALPGEKASGNHAADTEKEKNESLLSRLGNSHLIAVLMYMACSSTMLVVNKLAIQLFPAPNLLLVIQLSSSALVLWLLGQNGVLQVDSLQWDKLSKYWVVAAVFLLNIYTNIMALRSSNVETVIVFRCLTTVVVAVGDFKALRGEGLPSLPVMGSLLSICVFAGCYVYSESRTGVQVENYSWVIAYVVAQSIDCLYIKHIVSTVQMTSWGRSFYNNVLAMGPLLLPWYLSDSETVATLQTKGSFGAGALWAVVLSCVLGLCISVTAFHCRGKVSATSYSVIGNMNKVLTVLINCLIWNQHASATGVFWLMCCLVAGWAYSKVKPAGVA